MRKIIETNKFDLEFDLNSGTFNLISKVLKRIVIKNAFAQIKTTKGLVNTLNKKAKLYLAPFESNIGNGIKYRFDFELENDPFYLQLEIIKYFDSNIITIELISRNISNEDLFLEYISPFYLNSSQNGGLFVEDQPEKSIIYENGLGFAFEFFVRAINASEESDSSLMCFIYSKTNFEKNFLIGLLNPTSFIATININEESNKGIEIFDPYLNKNVIGIAEFKAQLIFPFPKVVHSGETISSGVWVLIIDSENGFEALESYADLIRIYNNIKVWNRSIPHGWNSWNNPVEGFKEYSYIKNINEEIILKNLDFAVDKLRSFGLEYFQIDDGYTKEDIMSIDEIDETKFPHGLKFIADKIHEKGLKAGIWINPFNIGINSKIYKIHTNWFKDPDPSFPIKNKNWKCFDLSIPEVQNYIRCVIRKVVKEWGFDLIKVDFAYHNLGPSKFSDPDLISTEIHRIGWKIIKEEAGPNVFIIGIGGPIGLHIGSVDGERIELDTLPIWSNPKMPPDLFDVPQTSGSIVFNYRTISRKYYLNYRVWINHLDCICFRPSCTRNETMCLANAIALFGGIFKIGDKIIDMKEEDLDVIRKMLPIHKYYARPVDLFRKLLPEIINLPIIKANYKWNVIGLFNWGENKDLITEEILPSCEKEISVNFKNDLNIEEEYCHVFDFWNQKYLGIFKNRFSTNLKPHFSNIYSIIPNLNIPQYLSSNRHITQGGIEILDSSILCSEKKINLKLNFVENFEHKLYFFISSHYKIENYKLNIISSQDKLNILKIEHKKIQENNILLIIFKVFVNYKDLINQEDVQNICNNFIKNIIELEINFNKY